jgi:hypothetical protein
MTRKIIGYYSDAFNQSNQGSLALELGDAHLACIVRTPESSAPAAFELFEIEPGSDPDAIFSEVLSASRILTRKYPNSSCYYNLEEALVMPAEKFQVGVAEDYLNLVYGDMDEMETRHEPVFGQPLHIIYRIPKSLHEAVRRHFVLYQPHHVFTRAIEQVLSRPEQPAHLVSLQFYPHHFNAAVFQNGALQLVRSFRFQSPEDVLYYLTSISQQFHIPAEGSVVEISGMFDAENISQKQLHRLFSSVAFSSVTGDDAFIAATSLYPPYFFRSFYNLPA